jgi:hypothetical protein
MGLSLVILLIALTSVGGCMMINRSRRLTTRSLLQAFGSLFDWAGLFTLFTTTNLALGVLLILLIRGFTPRFVSLYELENFLLLILSAVQAFVFHQLWKRA